MEPKFKLPTETVDLPSKGLFYPKDSALASGKVEIKYMTAKEEDILSNQNYIQKGVVIDKLLKSLIVDKKVDYNSLLTGDKNAIMLVARILAYGKTTIENKPLLKEVEENAGSNEFEFILPATENKVTFKLLNHKDEQSIEREVTGLQKINKEADPTGTTRFKHMITSVNGLKENKDIREFVDNYLLASDARALRAEYMRISPDVNLEVQLDGREDVVTLPITLSFFWPDVRI
jgi:hypothetical protein